MTVLAHTCYMTMRHLRKLARQPWWIAISLVQPVICLLLFGALFQRVTDLPGFGEDDYVAYLTPGIVVMTALFSGGWNGMGMLEDLQRGTLDRFLVAPVRRLPLVAGPLGQMATITVVQSLVIVGLSLALGATYAGGAAGVGVLVAAALLLALAMAGLSNALALVTRRQETLVGAVQFIVLPATFVATAFMPRALVPGWIADLARFNPVDWTVTAGREALSADVDWSVVGGRMALLAVLAAVAAVGATRALQSYRRSV
jgi:ABC-2 type transport system permease protein